MKKLNYKKLVIVCVVFCTVTTALVFGILKLTNTKDSDTQNNDNNMIKEETSKFAVVDYYKAENEDRYLAYQQENTELSIEDVVTHVNMHIDVPFFTNDPIIIDEPDAIDVLVNKVYQLPLDWVPSDLVVVDDFKGQQLQKVAAEAFLEMAEACKEEGFDIYVYSGYRSTEFQDEIYNNMVDVYGTEYSDQYVAKPGHSEHATGLAADVSIDGLHYEEIIDSEHYDFFKSQLTKYGFILRYLENSDHLTGYSYESWHIRYVGVELASEIEASGLTYDEYVARIVEE